MKTFLAAALIAFAVKSQAAPYVQGLWTKNNPVYVTGGETFAVNNLAPDAAVTAVAFAYHPLSAGSFWDLFPETPVWLAPLLPRESWACSVGGALGANSAGVIGCGVNLLDSVRQEASSFLEKSSSEKLNALGAQIAPGKGPLNLNVSRVEQDSLSRPLVFAPRWMLSASYGF